VSKKAEDDRADGGGGTADTNGADGYNAGYAEKLIERALRDRGLIPPSLAEWSGSAPKLEEPASPPPPRITGSVPEVVVAEDLRLAAIAGALVEDYRGYGHLAARLDPLGSPPPRHPLLSPEFHGVRREGLVHIPASAVQLEHLGETAADVLGRLEEIYCGSIGYELDQMENPAQRDWLVDYIESGRHRVPLPDDRARRLLQRLTRVEGLERFLHRSYLGKKRFSIEGLEMMIPMLTEILKGAGRNCTRQVFLGMAHRGRLNVLAHIIGLSYESILAEFEEQISRGIQTALPELGSGDVKYHVGGRGRVSEDDVELDVHLAPNPSHLEHVNPVVLGMARAARFLDEEAHPRCMLAILIHGDASFAGQGVVAETLNLCRLESYETGGTIHLIANNQLGFTTLPEESRSTRYASDLALGFRLPVVHVNADDPEACLAAARLAVDYRFEFGEDIVIDLVGYRRYGHNEGDEPGYTQPLMYKKIKEHPGVRELWADRLSVDGVVTHDEAQAMVDQMEAYLTEARESIQGGDVEATEPTQDSLARIPEPREDAVIETRVAADHLRALNDAVHRWPEDFQLFHKLGRQLEKRAGLLETSIDWGHAETLALGSLLTDGVPIRFTGEDTERGTFSHRHLVLHEATDGRTHVPLGHLAPEQAPIRIANSPLSEIATLGFEYGFSTIARDALVLWEAQFGDFVNVGQPIIDQFIVAGRSKWGQESRLVLLLPHGYEGQGPEHSSARLERFLQLAAQGNIRVANCTTPAQYFHLLRLQAKHPVRRPLVILTPKSLLRHPLARSSITDLSVGGFEPVLADERAALDPGRVERILLCSGKVYYDLLAAAEEREDRDRVAILRLERLYPFPAERLRAAVAAFPAGAELRWVQEEPANMGAWNFVRSRLEDLLGRRPAYVGRPDKASPAEGYAGTHTRRQRQLVRKALGE
jgi:2-oxoglutarate dehydrogenase E1 component